MGKCKGRESKAELHYDRQPMSSRRVSPSLRLPASAVESWRVVPALCGLSVHLFCGEGAGDDATEFGDVVGFGDGGAEAVFAVATHDGV